MGYLRFLLALTVTIYHLWTLKVLGGVAVFGFFCISGFVITKIINEVYGNTWKGKLYFLINRILRIYPTYYLCLAIGFFCIWLTGDHHLQFSRLMVFPRNWHEWLPQIFIFGTAGNPLFPVAVLPSSWSLNVELVYYLVMGILIGTSIRRCITWCVVSMGISGYLVWNHYQFNYHYYTVYGSSFCFAFGALLYHLKGRIPETMLLPKPVALTFASILAFIPISLGRDFSIGGAGSENYYIYLYEVLPIFLYVIVSLDTYQKPNKLEQLAADISYPMFLLHMPIGEVVAQHLQSKTLFSDFFFGCVGNAIFYFVYKDHLQAKSGSVERVP